jgi:tetratricopeptide (TPR) repeat protein
MMTKRPLFIGIFLMLLLTLAAYSNHFNNSFHFDDFHTIVNNANIRSLKNIPRFFADGSTSSVLPQNQAYRPVVVTSLAIDYWLAGDYFSSYFQTSTFVLFLLQGIMMVFIFLKIFNQARNTTINIYLSLIAVTWYMLHPANAETVNYIIARTDVQSTVFVLLAFVLYIFSPFCRKTFVYLIAVAIGALCKTTAVMFAPLLFFYVLLFEAGLSLADLFNKSHFKQVKAVFIKTLPAFICCIGLYVFTGIMTPKSWEPGGSSPLQYLITQPFVIFHYFGQFFLPTGLSADTDWRLLPSIWDIRFFAGCFFILVMIVMAFYTSKKQESRPVSYGIIWFFLALIPTSSIIPLGEVLNDHRMYFPFIGLVMSVAWAIGLLISKYCSHIKKPVLILPVLLLLATYAYGTWQRNKVWHTDDSLWHDVTIKSPQNSRGLMNYGLAKMNGGDYATAEAYIRKAINIAPEYSFLYTNLGIVKENEGNLKRADEYYQAGIELGNTYPDPYTFYAKFLIKQCRYNEARPLLLTAIKLSPLYVEPRLLLMNIYSMNSDWDKLKVLAQQTLEFSPQNQNVLNYLEAAKKKTNELDIEDEKIRQAPSAIKYADLSQANYQARRYNECVITAKEAINLNSQYAEAYNNMGAAYLKLQQYNNAVTALKQALALKPGLEWAQNNLIDAEEDIETKGIKNSGLTTIDFINLSLYYFNSRRYANCITACNNALAVNPAYDLAYNNICAAYNQLGQWDKAIAAAKKGLAINPNNQILKNNMAEAVKGLQQRKTK